MKDASWVQGVQAMLVDLGWSRSELARRAGVTPAAVTNWLNGHASPKMASLEAIAQAGGRRLSVQLLAPGDPESMTLTPEEALYIRRLRALRQYDDVRADEAVSLATKQLEWYLDRAADGMITTGARSSGYPVKS